MLDTPTIGVRGLIYLSLLHSTMTVLNSTQLNYTLATIAILIHSATLYWHSTWLNLTLLHSTMALIGSTTNYISCQYVLESANCMAVWLHLIAQ